MFGSRLEQIKFSIFHTDIKDEDLRKISRVLSLKEACLNHGLPKKDFENIMRDMINEADFRTNGEWKKPNGNDLIIECFTYEPSLETLYFWYNDKNNSTKVVKKTL